MLNIFSDTNRRVACSLLLVSLSLCFVFFVSSYYFSCLFYSHIHPLYIIILEWSSPSLNCSFACAWISLSYSVRVQSQIRVVSSSSISFLVSKSERAGQSKQHFNQQWHTHTHSRTPRQPDSSSLSLVCFSYIHTSYLFCTCALHVLLLLPLLLLSSLFSCSSSSMLLFVVMVGQYRVLFFNVSFVFFSTHSTRSSIFRMTTNPTDSLHLAIAAILSSAQMCVCVSRIRSDSTSVCRF